MTLQFPPSMQLRPLNDTNAIIHQLREAVSELWPYAPVLQAANMLQELLMQLNNRRFARHARQRRFDTRALRIWPVDAQGVSEADEEVVEIDLRARGASEDQFAAHGGPGEVVDPDGVRVAAGFGDGTVPGEAAVEAGFAGADEPAGDDIHAVEDGETFWVAVDVGKFR